MASKPYTVEELTAIAKQQEADESKGAQPGYYTAGRWTATANQLTKLTPSPEADALAAAILRCFQRKTATQDQRTFVRVFLEGSDSQTAIRQWLPTPFQGVLNAWVQDKNHTYDRSVDSIEGQLIDLPEGFVHEWFKADPKRVTAYLDCLQQYPWEGVENYPVYHITKGSTPALRAQFYQDYVQHITNRIEEIQHVERFKKHTSKLTQLLRELAENKINVETRRANKTNSH